MKKSMVKRREKSITMRKRKKGKKNHLRMKSKKTYSIVFIGYHSKTRKLIYSIIKT
jgi:hypothetical protein